MLYYAVFCMFLFCPKIEKSLEITGVFSNFKAFCFWHAIRDSNCDSCVGIAWLAGF